MEFTIDSILVILRDFGAHNFVHFETLIETSVRERQRYISKKKNEKEKDKKSSLSRGCRWPK